MILGLTPEQFFSILAICASPLLIVAFVIFMANREVKKKRAEESEQSDQ